MSENSNASTDELGLSPAEVQGAIDALPKGHVCLLTPRVIALEEQVAAVGESRDAFIEQVVEGVKEAFGQKITELEKKIERLESAGKKQEGDV